MPEFQNTDVADLMFGAIRLPPPLMVERVQHVGTTQETRDHIEETVGGAEWTAVWEKVEEKLPELFSIKLTDVLAGALNKCRELHRYTDLEKYPADRTVQVPLGEYKFSSTHKPRLEITVDGVDAGAIELVLRLDFRLQAAVAELRGGVIRALDTGGGNVKGSVSVGKIQVWESDSAQGELPGRIEFAKGIALGRLAIRDHDDDVLEQVASAPPVAVADNRRIKGDAAIVRRRSWLPALALLGGFALLGLVLLIEPTKQVVEPALVQGETYALTIISEPADANVNIIGLDRAYTPGMQLPPGRYDIEVSSPGFQPQQQVVHLGEADLKLPVQLVRSIQIDEPAVDPLPLPEVEQQETTQRTPPPRSSVDTRSPLPSPTELEEQVPGTYAVNLRSSPPGAQIWIRGVGDYEPGMRLPPGEYTVRLRLNGYQTTWESFTVRNRDVNERFELPKGFF